MSRLVILRPPWLGLVCLVAAQAAQVARHGADRWPSELLGNAVVYLIGVNAIVFGIGHVVFADRTAAAIGWPVGSPFQFEVGMANFAIGVPAVLAGSRGPDYWLPLIIAFTVFYGGAAWGHAREIVRAKNHAPGNAGPVFYFDFLAPIALIALYVAAT
ncbi:MAG TPA: DUF6790 family protein [Thermomicrobiales bacterium]|jgi:hypothetical protein